MLFFFLAMLSCLLVPWTAAVVWHLLFPGRAEAGAGRWSDSRIASLTSGISLRNAGV